MWKSPSNPRSWKRDIRLPYRNRVGVESKNNLMQEWPDLIHTCSGLKCGAFWTQKCSTKTSYEFVGEQILVTVSKGTMDIDCHIHYNSFQEAEESLSGWSSKRMCLVDTGTGITKYKALNPWEAGKVICLVHKAQAMVKLSLRVQICLFIDYWSVCAKTSSCSFLLLSIYNLRLLTHRYLLLRLPDSSLWMVHDK